MAIKYEIDGDIFREINEKFLVAYVNEYLIKARVLQMDAAGNEVEFFQLNDGRCFSRIITPHRESAVVREPTLPSTIPQRVTGS
ncbi:MAG TPA: hypothetical protein VK206_15915 [Anaerolineales bacterium]|nr:hypothetical protein [Anaerolineales bacterium]